jgi:hypothetical protein
MSTGVDGGPGQAGFEPMGASMPCTATDETAATAARGTYGGGESAEVGAALAVAGRSAE